MGSSNLALANEMDASKYKENEKNDENKVVDKASDAGVWDQIEREDQEGKGETKEKDNQVLEGRRGLDLISEHGIIFRHLIPQ